MSTERKTLHRVVITLPDGRLKTYPILACSKYHAVELIYSDHRSEQPDRTKYKGYAKHSVALQRSINQSVN